MEDDKKPWEQRGDEGASAYQGFGIYRDMGTTRSVEKAWRVYAEQRQLKGMYPSRAFLKWCSVHEWVVRCDAFDRYEAQARLAMRDEIRDSVRRKLLKASDGIAERLIEVALGMYPDSKSHEIKAAQEVLDRAGITVVKDVNLAITDKPASADGWRAKIAKLDELDARELAAIYREAIKDDGDP